MKVSDIIAAREGYVCGKITQWRKVVDAELNRWSKTTCQLTTFIVYNVDNAEERTLFKTWITEYLNGMRDAKGEIIVTDFPAYAFDCRDNEGFQKITLALKVY